MPNTSVSNIDSHSEEVQEILEQVPNWIVRWGITTFTFILSILLIGSYFFKYPTKVSAPFSLTTINPPAIVISNSSGRISKWYIKDGDCLKKGEPIALIENSASFKDVKALKSTLGQLKGEWQEDVQKLVLDRGLSLGSLSSHYESFATKYEEMKIILQQDLTGKKISSYNKQIEVRKYNHSLLLKQWKLKKEEFSIIQSMYSRDSLAYYTGGYGIDRNDFESVLKTYLTHKAEMLNFEKSIADSELSVIKLKDEVIQLEISKRNEVRNLTQSLEQSQIELETQLKNWWEAYLIESPVEGYITLTKYWSSNQLINTGSSLATIIPIDESYIIARAYVPSSNLVNIEVGQKVNIKLAGFPYMKFGHLRGKVSSFSLVPDNNGHIVEIALTEGMKSTYKETLRFVQEMKGTADIITGESRYISHFIDPLKYLLN